MKRQVFLGGACGSTRWRRTIAIPLLEAAGVTFFDPQLGAGEWTEAYEDVEMQAKSEADVLLFVVNGETRGVATVAEVAFYLGTGRALALAVTDVAEGAVVDGRRLDRPEVDDLNRGRIFVRTMARELRVPVFRDVEGAVRHAIGLVGPATVALALAELRAILADVAFKGAEFHADETADGFVVQLRAGGKGDGRRWAVSRSATRSEIVQTALKAALTWEEHEAREAFRYRGVPVFGPHHDVDALARLARPIGGSLPLSTEDD